MGGKEVAPFKTVLDEAVAKREGLKIGFTPKGIKQLRELRSMIGNGIAMSTMDERFLSTFDRSGKAEGCEVTITLTGDFPKNRQRFEDKVLTGVESLTPV